MTSAYARNYIHTHTLLQAIIFDYIHYENPRGAAVIWRMPLENGIIQITQPEDLRFLSSLVFRWSCNFTTKCTRFVFYPDDSPLGSSRQYTYISVINSYIYNILLYPLINVGTCCSPPPSLSCTRCTRIRATTCIII